MDLRLGGAGVGVEPGAVSWDGVVPQTGFGRGRLPLVRREPFETVCPFPLIFSLSEGAPSWNCGWCL